MDHYGLRSIFLASVASEVSLRGCDSDQAKARSKLDLAAGTYSHNSSSGMTWAVLIVHTPSLPFPTGTKRPAYSLPNEICPLAPMVFISRGMIA